MNYLVTGATGFIGRFLVEKLLARPDIDVNKGRTSDGCTGSMSAS